MISLILLVAVTVLYYVLRIAIGDFGVQEPAARTFRIILTVFMLLFLIVTLVTLWTGHPIGPFPR